MSPPTPSKAAMEAAQEIYDADDCISMSVDTIAAILDRHAASAWQGMESAPKDGSPILVCNELYTDNGFLPIAVRWRAYHPNARGNECFRDHNGHKVDRVTHWMPLPAAPTPSGEPTL